MTIPPLSISFRIWDTEDGQMFEEGDAKVGAFLCDHCNQVHLVIQTPVGVQVELTFTDEEREKIFAAINNPTKAADVIGWPDETTVN